MIGDASATGPRREAITVALLRDLSTVRELGLRPALRARVDCGLVQTSDPFPRIADRAFRERGIYRHPRGFERRKVVETCERSVRGRWDSTVREELAEDRRHEQRVRSRRWAFEQ
jgi:hypothetical protein